MGMESTTDRICLMYPVYKVSKVDKGIQPDVSSLKEKKSLLGKSQRALRKDPTASAGTNSESQQLEAQLGASKLMQIRRVFSHPSRLASRPPGSPSSSPPPLPNCLDC
eukprot:245276-Pelagomonas_calceolata.AAC.2